MWRISETDSNIGQIAGAHTVEVNGKRYTAKHILVAVGGRATVPNIPGKEHVITSDEALDLAERPKKICIIGGGYIALEFAGIFNGFGTEVHVFIRGNKALRGFDEEVVLEMCCCLLKCCHPVCLATSALHCTGDCMFVDQRFSGRADGSKGDQVPL